MMRMRRQWVMAVKNYFNVLEEQSAEELAMKVTVYLDNGWFVSGGIFAVVEPGGWDGNAEDKKWRPTRMLYLQAVYKIIER
jgi:hypothetical protein